MGKEIEEAVPVETKEIEEAVPVVDMVSETGPLLSEVVECSQAARKKGSQVR